MSIKTIFITTWNAVRLYLSFLLFVFYLVVGCLFLFTDTWSGFLPEGKEIVGGILVLFGVLRFYISFRRYRKTHTKIQYYKAKNQKDKQPDKEEKTEDAIVE